MDGQESAGTRAEQLGFPEPGAEDEGAGGSGPAGSSLAERARAPEQPAGSGEGKMEEKGGSGGDAGGEQLRVVKHELRTGERPAPCRPGSALGCAGRGGKGLWMLQALRALTRSHY